jgi:hypothetical protein
LRKTSAIGFPDRVCEWESTLARKGGQAAVAVKQPRTDKVGAGSDRRPLLTLGKASGPDAAAPTDAAPAFHERALFQEGHAAAFRIQAGGGWATGALPAGASDNAIAKFLSDAVNLAKQMRTAMVRQPGDGAEVEILIAAPHATAKQSAIKVTVDSSSSTVVTLQPGDDAGHLVSMLQHFLTAVNLTPRNDAHGGAAKVA